MEWIFASNTKRNDIIMVEHQWDTSLESFIRRPLLKRNLDLIKSSLPTLPVYK